MDWTLPSPEWNVILVGNKELHHLVSISIGTCHPQFDNSDWFNPRDSECSQYRLSLHEVLDWTDALLRTDRQNIDFTSGVQLKCNRHVTHSKLRPPISVLYVSDE